LNLLLQHGFYAAGTYAANPTNATTQPARIGVALTQSTPVNPHLKYVDTDAQGYGYAKVTATQIDAQLVTINRPVGAASMTAPGIKRTASFVIPKDDPAGMTTTVTGTKPFPLT
jgi:alkaline phosphatase D